MKDQSQHIVPDQHGKWSVRRGGAERAAKVFSTQHDAVTYAKDIAKKQGGELYVHRIDGTIKNKDSYANHPHHKHKP